MNRTLLQPLLLLLLLLAPAAARAQQAPDFAEKFMQLFSGDSTVSCVTVSPKMMEQLVAQHTQGRPDGIEQAIGKLKSARIISASAAYYQKAEDLLLKNSSRFRADQDYRTPQQHGAFYTRRNKKGQTVELILLHETCDSDRLTIVNVTGNIDEEFLCFLYNNKTFKN